MMRGLTITCDRPGCTARYRAAPGVGRGKPGAGRGSEGVARRALARGWTRPAGRDLCPECSALAAAAPDTGRDPVDVAADRRLEELAWELWCSVAGRRRS